MVFIIKKNHNKIYNSAKFFLFEFEMIRTYSTSVCNKSKVLKIMVASLLSFSRTGNECWEINLRTYYYYYYFP